MYPGLATKAKDEIEIDNLVLLNSKTPKNKTKIMTKKDCDICKKSGKIHFRVKSINHTKWIFCCKKCWDIISKEDQYSYGGTRKSLQNIDIKSH